MWRLEHIDPKAQVTILADSYEGKQLNSPNDLVYKSDGSLYFTDPPYGLRTQKDDDPEKQLTVNGVYRLHGATAQKPGAPPANAQLQLLIKDLPRPNGLAFSPDEKYLYVNNSEPKKIWMRYTVQPDGTLTDGKLFFDATSDPRPGSPDGMKVDQQATSTAPAPGASGSSLLKASILARSIFRKKSATSPGVAEITRRSTSLQAQASIASS